MNYRTKKLKLKKKAKFQHKKEIQGLKLRDNITKYIVMGEKKSKRKKNSRQQL